MTKILLTLMAAATLVACATPKREGPPAPVVSAAQPKPVQVVAPPPTPRPPPVAPAPRPVQVYAYRPPSEAARIPDEVVAVPPQTDVETQAIQASKPEVLAEAKPVVSTRREVAPPALPSRDGVKTPTKPEPAKPGPAKPEPTKAEPAKPGLAKAEPAKPESTKPKSAKPEPPTPSDAPAAREVTAAAQPATPATPTETLRVQAERQRQSGDYAGAAATLERALSYQPRDAGLWNRLARVRMEQGLNSQAANLAAKSNSLAGGADQVALRRDNWSIIATVRRQTGDAAGAQEAELKARGA